MAQLSQTIEQQRQAIEQQRPPPASSPPTGHASQNDVQDVQERLSVLEQRVGSAESPVKHASRHDLLDVQERLSVLEQRGGSAESPAKQQRQQVVLREIEEAQQESRLWISTTGSRMEKDVRELASTVEQDGATKEELRSLRGDVAKLVAVETSGRQALSESLAQLQARQGGDGGGVSKRELSSVRAELLRLFAELETQCAGLSGELERVLQQRDGDGPSKLEASALRAELAERPTRDMVDEQIAHEVAHEAKKIGDAVAASKAELHDACQEVQVFLMSSLSDKTDEHAKRSNRKIEALSSQIDECTVEHRHLVADKLKAVTRQHHSIEKFPSNVPSNLPSNR